MNNPFTNTNYDIRNQALHFNDFYHRLCISLQGYLGNAGVSPFPLVLTSFGKTALEKIFGGTAFPHDPRSLSTTPLASAVIFKSKNYPRDCLQNFKTFFGI